METNIFYRVRPESLGFSHEDFNTIEEAISRANARNSVRVQKGETDLLYKGDNCVIQKVTITVEHITK